MTTQQTGRAASWRIDRRRPGRRIGDARRDRGESIEELAVGISRLLGYTVSGQTIKNMEAGRTHVYAWMVPVFAEHQGKSLAWYLVDDPYNDPSSAGRMRPYVESKGAQVIPFPSHRRTTPRTVGLATT